VIHVDDADRHQDQAGTQVQAAAEQAVDVGLLDLDLAGVIGRRDGVLDLDLGVEADAVGEVVADEEGAFPGAFSVSSP
jgi:hypothetical protein